MARQAKPQQPSNDDDNAPERPDVSNYMTPLALSRDGESFNQKGAEDGSDE